MRLTNKYITADPQTPTLPLHSHQQATTGRWTDIIWWIGATSAVQHVYYIDGTVAVREYSQ